MIKKKEKILIASLQPSYVNCIATSPGMVICIAITMVSSMLPTIRCGMV